MHKHTDSLYKRTDSLYKYTVASLMQKLLEIVTHNHDSAYVVGGFVRDLLVGRYSKDIDVLVMADARMVAKEFADQCDGSYIVLDSQHHAYRVVFTKDAIEFDIVGPKGKGPDVKADLRRRDFTVNALAIPMQAFLERNQGSTESLDVYDDVIIDCVNGLQDLMDRRISIVYMNAIIDDPLRILRGVRLAGQLSFSISSETKERMKSDKQGIVNVSFERIRDEFWTILALEHSSFWLGYIAEELELFSELIPELKLEQQLNGIERVRRLEKLLDLLMTDKNGISDYLRASVGSVSTRVPLLKFAALLKDVSVSQIRNVSTRWKLSRKEASILHTWLRWDEELVSFHDLYETYHQEAIGAMILHAQNKADLVEQLHKYIEYVERRLQCKHLISGKDIIEVLGIPPGKTVKELLLLQERAQLDGIISTREGAIAYLAQKI